MKIDNSKMNLYKNLCIYAKTVDFLSKMIIEKNLENSVPWSVNLQRYTFMGQIGDTMSHLYPIGPIIYGKILFHDPLI